MRGMYDSKHRRRYLGRQCCSVLDMVDGGASHAGVKEHSGPEDWQAFGG